MFRNTSSETCAVRIKQFKEAFSLIDVDGDGQITEEDLRVTMGNLGQLVPRRLTFPGS